MLTEAANGSPVLSQGKPRFLAITKAKEKLRTAPHESGPRYTLIPDSALQDIKEYFDLSTPFFWVLCYSTLNK